MLLHTTMDTPILSLFSAIHSGSVQCAWYVVYVKKWLWRDVNVNIIRILRRYREQNYYY